MLSVITVSINKFDNLNDLVMSLQNYSSIQATSLIDQVYQLTETNCRDSPGFKWHAKVLLFAK